MTLILSKLRSPDCKEMPCVYHRRNSKTGNERVFFDRMKILPSGWLTTYGQTTRTGLNFFD